MSDIAVDFAFRADYSIEVVSLLLEFGKTFFSIDATGKFEKLTTSGNNSTSEQFLQIKPSDESPWLLRLYGEFDANSAQGIYACPNSNFFLAVMDGVAFYVNSKLPFEAQVLKDSPVQSVLSYPSLDFLLVLDFTNMTAIDKSGILWSSKRLVLDELKVISISDKEIFCDGISRFSFDDSVLISRMDGRILKKGFHTE